MESFPAPHWTFPSPMIWTVDMSKYYLEVRGVAGQIIMAIEDDSIAFLTDQAADELGHCAPWDLVHDVVDRTGIFTEVVCGKTAIFTHITH